MLHLQQSSQEEHKTIPCRVTPSSRRTTSKTSEICAMCCAMVHVGKLWVKTVPKPCSTSLQCLNNHPCISSLKHIAMMAKAGQVRHQQVLLNITPKPPAATRAQHNSCNLLVQVLKPALLLRQGSRIRAQVVIPFPPATVSLVRTVLQICKASCTEQRQQKAAHAVVCGAGDAVWLHTHCRRWPYTQHTASAEGCLANACRPSAS